MQIFPNKTRNLYNLLKGKSLSNDQSANFGFKKTKDEIIWFEDEKNNFDINVVEIMVIENEWDREFKDFKISFLLRQYLGDIEEEDKIEDLLKNLIKNLIKQIKLIKISLRNLKN